MNPINISKSGLRNLTPENIKQEKKEDISSKLSPDSEEDDINKKRIEDNKLVFFNSNVDYKIYKFNGNIEKSDSHLGNNFDVTL